MNNTNQTTPQYLAQRAIDESLVSSIITNVVVSAVIFLVFVLFRYFFRQSYILHPAAPVDTGLLDWLKITKKISWNQFFNTHGLDSLIYLRFIWSLCQVLILMMSFAMVVTIPVTITGSRRYLSLDNPLRVSGSAVVTISNIDSTLPVDVNRYWAILGSVYFNTLVSFYFFFKVYRSYHKYRIKLRSGLTPYNLTVKIKHVPSHMTAEELNQRLEKVFPNKLIVLHHVPNIPHIVDMQRRKKDLELKRSRISAIYSKNTYFAKFLRCLSCESVKGDVAIVRINRKISVLDEKIVEAQHSKFTYSHVVYATFKESLSARICAQSILDQDPFAVHPSLAPHPQDILWDNHRINPFQKKIQSHLVTVVVFFLIVFWAIPVGFASSLANLKTLATLLDYEQEITTFSIEHSKMMVWIEGILPAFVIWIFYLILMPLLRWLSTYQGYLSLSKVDEYTLHKVFAFLIVNVFFTSLFAGTAINVWHRLVFFATNPPELFPLVASSIPAQVNYFIGYVLLNSLFVYSLQLLRPWWIFLRALSLCFYAYSTEEIEEANRSEGIDYPYFYGMHLLIYLIVVTYSSIAPVMLPFGFLYFVIAYFAHTHNLIFVTKQPFEGFGNLWPPTFTQLCLALAIYQSIIMTILGLNGFYYSFLLSPLILVTYAYWYYTNKRMLPVTEFGSLDMYNSEKPLDPALIEDLKVAYLHPGLLPPKKGQTDKSAHTKNELEEDRDIVLRHNHDETHTCSEMTKINLPTVDLSSEEIVNLSTADGVGEF